ncbi:aspartyl/asparaginyl beta-hydroxylase domain-containing protein [Pseudoxanthomonas suwonensis]|uniref:aspartyl/asparaginyl beta-hydroxylase domain-containing protein n=1 Tax=Pseudoxanthomonas suwonensis TaxID=314722 RepID=UPI0009E232B9|nr:aspartyl/asparaginyl beta-hydroxylase domain-containing protein [Pseudoxanthomonas suwonensis]
MNSRPPPQLASLVAEAEALTRSGRPQEARELWERVLALDSGHSTALNQLGAVALAHGDLDLAESHLERAVAISPRMATAHASLSRLHAIRGDRQRALAAIDVAIQIDPTAWVPQVQKARLLEELGQSRAAGLHWGNALNYMPETVKRQQHMLQTVMHAQAAVQRNQDELASHLDDSLAPLLHGHGPREVERIRHSLDILAGRRSFTTARPLTLPIPRLPAIPIFHREDFDWAPEVEAAFPDILEELHALLDRDAEFEPYVQTPDGQPKGQFAALDRNVDWGAYFLWKHGQRIHDQADRCPRTEAAIARAPQMKVPGRAPVAFFSALKPGVHIPPHNGATNARLTVHLPLVIPPDCALRVGDETHVWEPGRLVMFDDTIRHEAWNRSERLRVVLIFDVWHPLLTPLERELVAAMTGGLMSFYGHDADLGEL